MSVEDAVDWDVPAFPGGTLPVRNANEANLFIDVMRGTYLDSRIVGSDFQLLAKTAEGPRIFSFRIAAEKPVDVTDVGEGTSTVLSAVDLVLYASRVERELPDPPAFQARNGRRLRLAAAALRQAARFAAGAPELPQSTFQGAMAKRLFQENPDRFHTASLIAEAERLERLASAWR